jgi:hypothetical protein
MVAFIYNQLPEARKQMFEVNFVTPDNLAQVQRMLPELKGTPSLFDLSTNTNVAPGDPTLYAMLQLAYSWNVLIRLAQLHPDCVVYDTKFDGMIRAMMQQSRPDPRMAHADPRMAEADPRMAEAEPRAAPRNQQELLAYIVSLPLPRGREEQAAFLRQVKQQLGYIPLEIIAKINDHSQTGKVVTGTTVTKDIRAFSGLTPKAAEELKKLAGAPLGDPQLDAIIGTTKLESPFVDVGPDDSYEMAAVIQSGDTVLSEIDNDNTFQDTLSKTDPRMFAVTAPGEAPVSGLAPAGLPESTRRYLDQMRAQLEAKHGSQGQQQPASNVRPI